MSVPKPMLGWFHHGDLWVARIERDAAFDCEACVEQVGEVYAWWAEIVGVTYTPRSDRASCTSLEDAQVAAEAHLFECIEAEALKANSRLEAAREALGRAYIRRYPGVPSPPLVRHPPAPQIPPITFPLPKLEGDQGLGKGRALRALADTWFSEDLPDTTSKDSLQATRDTIYVSPEGRDSWPGTEAQPFYSVELAVERAQEITGATVIVVGPGAYDGRTHRWSRDGVVVEPCGLGAAAASRKEGEYR